jgi:hypothetical protein
VLSRNRAVIGGSCVRVADRDRKKLEEFFAGSWPARVMMVGVAKESINVGKCRFQLKRRLSTDEFPSESTI